MRGRDPFLHLTRLILDGTPLGVHSFSTSVPSTGSVPGARQELGDSQGAASQPATDTANALHKG